MGATTQQPEYYQQTGATSHAVNDLVLFVENNEETAQVRDVIFNR